MSFLSQRPQVKRSALRIAAWQFRQNLGKGEQPRLSLRHGQRDCRPGLVRRSSAPLGPVDSSRCCISGRFRARRRVSSSAMPPATFRRNHRSPSLRWMGQHAREERIGRSVAVHARGPRSRPTSKRARTARSAAAVPASALGIREVPGRTAEGARRCARSSGRARRPRCPAGARSRSAWPCVCEPTSTNPVVVGVAQGRPREWGAVVGEAGGARRRGSVWRRRA